MLPSSNSVTIIGRTQTSSERRSRDAEYAPRHAIFYPNFDLFVGDPIFIFDIKYFKKFASSCCYFDLIRTGRNRWLVSEPQRLAALNIWLAALNISDAMSFNRLVDLYFFLVH